jgi:hypothetical protein
VAPSQSLYPFNGKLVVAMQEMIHAKVHKYMLVDGACQKYTVSTGTHYFFHGEN